MEKFGRRIDRGDRCVSAVLFSFVFVLYLLITVSSLWQKSSTCDEGIILASACHFWKTGDPRINPENPYLLKSLLALPLLPLSLKEPEIKPKLLNSYGMSVEFRYAREFLFKLNDANTILRRSRLVSVILSFVAGVLVYLSLKRFVRGRWAFCGMLLLLASPNFLAHARLATVDAGFAMFFFGTSYFLQEYLFRKRLVWALGAGVMAGGAMLSKFTGVLVLPICGVQLLAYVLFQLRGERLLRAVTAFLLMALCAWLMIGAVYRFKGMGGTLAEGNFRSPLLEEIATMPLLDRVPLLVPEAYVRGFDIVAYNNRPGLPNIFMGKMYPQGNRWWYYYVVVSLVKMPIPFLVMIVFGLVVNATLGFRKWQFWFMLVPPLLIFLNFNLIASRQLGIRYILPMFPYCACCSVIGIRFLLRYRRKFIRLLARFCLIWFFAESLLIYPHYLSYYNQFAGGPRKGWRWFAASNLDWGQDLPSLRRWIEAHGNPSVFVLCWGYSDYEYEYYGVKHTPSKPEYVAISATMTYIYRDNPYMIELLKTKPVDQVGYSILIFRPLESEQKR